MLTSRRIIVQSCGRGGSAGIAEADQDQITVSIDFSIALDAKNCVYNLYTEKLLARWVSPLVHIIRHSSQLIVSSAPKKGQKMSLNEFLGDDSQQTEALLSACDFLN